MLQLAYKYIYYWLAARNGKGHGIHSPFVFEFITQVLNDNRKYYCYAPIERLREQLKRDKTELIFEDYGAGSQKGISYKRTVSEVALNSLKRAKYAQLLFRMVNFYQPENILELGTSLGITTAYLASANINVPLVTLEGAKAVAAIARQNLFKLQLYNINIVEGNFDDTLKSTINHTFRPVDFAFIDGNHRKEPSLRYFHEILSKTTAGSILVFDDIHWSKEMEEAWEYIKSYDAVTLTIDLFFIGIVFFRKEQKAKQHFRIRF